MKVKFTIFTVTYIIINLFSLYYIVAFTIIYEKSAESWLEGAILSLFLDWVCLEIGTVLAQVTIRSIAQRSPYLR